MQKKYFLNYFFILVVSMIGLSSCSSLRKSSKEKHSEKEHPKTKTGKAEKEKKQQLQEKYAQLLNVSPIEIKNLPLYFFIDDWYGIPYKYGGKTKNGIDCSNFVSLIFNNIYNKNIVGTSANLYEMCDSIDQSDLKEGDLVFFKIEQDKISHIGLYLTNGRFVHATTKKGIMINNLFEPYYKKYFFSAGRLKKLVAKFYHDNAKTFRNTFFIV